ncbi:hypothetical protein ACHHYP_20700 [Achlya hypogyna]|uniref:PH domain-containing protein n=1 Tax=Achlya hypogyna TaxID=1202772 RepID=A0A1V9ZF90_ACHHY|nr:hypothetical protein ACHHYP_20700 [Achlya hypogyna]
MSGWLRLKSVSGLMSIWKRRFFVLKGTSLYEYDSENTFEEGHHKATRRLLSVRRVASLPLTLHIIVATGKKPKSYYLATYDSASLEQWRRAFLASCGPGIAKVLDESDRMDFRSPSHVSSTGSTASSSHSTPILMTEHDAEPDWRRTSKLAADAMHKQVLYPTAEDDDEGLDALARLAAEA